MLIKDISVELTRRSKLPRRKTFLFRLLIGVVFTYGIYIQL